MNVFALNVVGAHKLNKVIKRIDWWININPQHSFNVPHVHPKSDIAVVYYAKVDDESSVLSLVRNDGAIHTSLYDKQPQMLNFTIKPAVGRLYAFPSHLIHYVRNNASEDDRVSIAFNVTLE